MPTFNDFKLFVLKLVKFTARYDRSSRPQMFCEKDVLTNFVIFTGNFITKRFQHMFSYKYCKIYRNTYFGEHLPTAAFVMKYFP